MLCKQKRNAHSLSDLGDTLDAAAAAVETGCELVDNDVVVGDVLSTQNLVM